ncbi:MAG: hypothetical protein U5K51_10775 [Flavobacteriaceae bacterium]|nr:hypothetical protein [Flavobacteriaceae bacterium]
MNKIIQPIQQSYTFASHTNRHTSQSLQKSLSAQSYRRNNTADRQTIKDRRAACNSTYKKFAVQWLHDALCFLSTFVVTDSYAPEMAKIC